MRSTVCVDDVVIPRAFATHSGVFKDEDAREDAFDDVVDAHDATTRRSRARIVGE